MIRLIGTEGIRKRDFNEIYREESKSEIIHERINTNKEKYAIDKTEHGEPLSIAYFSLYVLILP